MSNGAWGGFADGFANGLKIGQSMKNNQQDDEAAAQAKQAIEDAKTQQFNPDAAGLKQYEQNYNETLAKYGENSPEVQAALGSMGDTGLTYSGGKDPAPVQVKTQYKLGTSYQDNAPTRDQLAGVSDDASAEYWSGKGGEHANEQLQAINQRGLVRLQTRKAKREEDADAAITKMNADLAPVIKQINGMKMDDPERQNLVGQVQSRVVQDLGVAKGAEYMANTLQIDKATREAQRAQIDAMYEKAIADPAAAAKYYSEMTGHNVILHKSKDGTTHFIQDNNGNGRYDEGDSPASLGSFRNWEKDGVPALLKSRADNVDWLYKENTKHGMAMELKRLEGQNQIQAVSARSASHAATLKQAALGVGDNGYAVYQGKDGPVTYTEGPNGEMIAVPYTGKAPTKQAKGPSGLEPKDYATWLTARGGEGTVEQFRADMAKLSPQQGGAPQSSAHDDALRALQTGRISFEDANKRLVGAGLEPLPAEADPARARRVSAYEAEQQRKKDAYAAAHPTKPAGLSSYAESQWSRQ